MHHTEDRLPRPQDRVATPGRDAPPDVRASGRGRSRGRTGRPARRDLVWRSSRNPIIPRDLLPRSNSIFNSAVVPVRRTASPASSGSTTAVAHDEPPRRAQRRRHRLADRARADRVRAGGRPGRRDRRSAFEHAYDPRVTWLEDRYYVTWCNGYHGPTIGLGYTHDFGTFHQLDNAFLPFNRNGVLFPRRIGGRVRDAQPAERQRPHARSATSSSRRARTWSTGVATATSWRRCRWTWESTKIGAGPTPIETAEGWLLIYHGVLTSCNGFVYSMGAALLDLDEPWKVIARSDDYLLSPQVSYEQVGDVPNVVFPCAALVDAATDRLTDLLRGGRHGHVPGPRPPLRGRRVAAIQARIRGLRRWLTSCPHPPLPVSSSSEASGPPGSSSAVSPTLRRARSPRPPRPSPTGSTP